MGMEKVRDEIIEKANEQASLVISQVKKSAESMLREAENKLESYRASSLEEAKNAMIDIKRQEMARAEMESKKILMHAKKEILDGIFDQAKKNISGLPEKEMSPLLLLLLEKARKEIDIEGVYCNPRDAKFFRGFKAEKSGISGGFIAENKAGTIRSDYSFDSYFESLKESIMDQVSGKVFA